MKQLFTFLLLISMFISCTKSIEFVSETPPPHFLNSILEVNQSPIVYTGQALSVSDSINIFYDCNSTVTLIENNNSLDMFSSPIKEDQCYYTSTSQIAPLKNYEITATGLGNIIMKSVLTTPEIVPVIIGNISIDKIIEEFDEFLNKSYVSYLVKIPINISPSDYEKVIWNGITVLVPLEKNPTIYPFHFEKTGGFSIKYESFEIPIDKKVQVILTDKIPKEELIISFMVRIEKGTLDLNFKFSFFNIEDNFYKFYKKLLEHQNSFIDPFTVPVSAYNNIENGVGLFGAIAEYSKDISIELP